ncbi:O-antigen ligase family protein [Halomonas sp. EGI 63088]|uniref:O-antigen ligase family protein n=1 Tax=Halomonas flagellata TaxID=2920385 RepID=A0ABS9RST6_9GAMM|nr:O-antigen ligase family protein [Halomonas flagellata]MCH4562908.1 O-antigen ligase family protein [Halomonas flagellata]
MIDDGQHRTVPGRLARLAHDRQDQCHARLAGMALAFFGLGFLVLPWWALAIVPLLLGLAALLSGERPPLPFPRRQDRWVMAVLLCYGLSWVIAGPWHDEGLRGLKEAAPVWLALLALVALSRLRVSSAWLWGGVAAGSLATGGWAVWQRLVENASRVNGHEPLHAILFGNLGLLAGLICLAGLCWAFGREQRRRWMLLLAVGGLAGLMTSALSGSRGGWVGLPLALWVLYRGYGPRLAPRWRLAGFGLLVLLVAGLYVTPQTGVERRVDNAVASLEEYLAGDPEMTSVSARVEMWQGAMRLIAERPLVGWGARGYRQAMRDRGAAGLQHPALGRFWHAHNDLLDAWAKRGLPGLLTLLALYLVPLWLFLGGIRSAARERRALAMAGILLPVAFLGFGLTYSFLAYPAGGLVYGLLLAILWGLYRQVPVTGQGRRSGGDAAKGEADP